MKFTMDLQKAEQAFSAGVAYMSKLTGLDRRRILIAEAGSILKACAGDTKVANAAELERGIRLRTLRGLGLTHGGPVTINAGVKPDAPYGRVFMRKRGGSGFRRTHDADFVPVNRHYRESDWNALQGIISDAQSEIARALPPARHSAALARQSWILIADSLGIRLESVPGGRLSAGAITKARDAFARNGVNLRNGTSEVRQTSTEFFLTLINRLPYGNRLGFQDMLTSKINGRTQFIARALAKGFTASAQNLTKLFPGWVVNTRTAI